VGGEGGAGDEQGEEREDRSHVELLDPKMRIIFGSQDIGPENRFAVVHL
jgi:hypothetical protein